MFPRSHETLDVGKSKMAETSVPQKELLLCGGDVLIRLIEDNNPVIPCRLQEVHGVGSRAEVVHPSL